MKRESKSTGPSQIRVWRQRGTLTALFLVFVASGLLRLGQIDIAFADTTPADASAAANAMPGNDVTMSSVVTALAAIEERATALDMREAEIADRQSRLDAAEELVSTRLAELEAAEARLTELLSVADSAASNDLDQLTQLYETMASADAAELFAQMDPSFAAGFLSRMTPEAGAGILSELAPDQAYAISIILATRNADVPVSGDATR